jgi:hypothetical protein
MDGLVYALKQFSAWLNRKSSSIAASYKPAAVRAFYLSRFRILSLDLSRSLSVSRDLNFFLDVSHALDLSLDSAIELASQIQVDDQLLSVLRATKVDLQCFPKQGASDSDFELWRRLIREQYLQLRQACISHRDLGHDWQFTDREVQCLEKYIFANQLLVDCMKSECYISPEVREELEKNLLIENFDEQP